MSGWVSQEREAMAERVGQLAHERESETQALRAKVAELEQASRGAPRSAGSLAEELVKVCGERDAAEAARKVSGTVTPPTFCESVNVVTRE
jgi:hypothetical protein